MSDYIDISNEIKRIESQLINKDIISTVDVALIYNMCDKFIKYKTGIDILTMFDQYEYNPEALTRYIMAILYTEPEILNFITAYNVNELLAKTIYSMGNKEIVTINEKVIQNSNKRPYQMDMPTDSNQIKRIFRGLRRNYFLYEQLYKDKIWLINSRDLEGNEITNARVKISPYMFFHLMGFDYANILNPNGRDRNGNTHEMQAKEFAAIFPNPEQAFKLLQDFGKNAKNQYELIELLLDNEENFLEAALSGNLSHTVNIDKLELKSYAFERMGMIESPSGMILFDRNKAFQLGYGSEVQHINTDIILLNDFIRKYHFNNLFGLDFVFSPFDKIKGNQISDQQSIFLTRQSGGGFNSHLFDQQMASVSTSVAGYRDNDFTFNITEKGAEGENPPVDPDSMKTFSDEDIKRVAQTMKETMPGLDQTLLNELTKTDGNIDIYRPKFKK